MKQEKTSLEKSHSKWSNFKLTVLCMFASIVVSCLWIGLGLLNKFDWALYLAIGGGACSLLSLMLINKFVR